MSGRKVVNVSAREHEEMLAAETFCASMPEAQSDDALPESIQLFPPGTHNITATGADNKPAKMVVKVTKKTADAIADSFKAMIAAAAKGEGPKPYIDFNHEDREASGWPTSVYWAGEDPKEGGVRAKLEWSEPGKAAIRGKAYRAFSPNFAFDRDAGEVVGTGPNMGGLVNRPAFRRINGFFAKDAEKPKQEPNMNRLLMALAAAGLVTSPSVTEEVAATEFTANWKAAENSRKDAEAKATKLAAEIETVRAKEASTAEQLGRVKVDLDRVQLVAARAVVEGWVRESRIAPKDKETQDRLINVLAKDPSQAEILEGILPAKGDPTTAVVKAKAVPENNHKAASSEFMVKARAHAESNKCGLADAMAAVAASEPNLYDAYRAAL